MMLAPTRGFTRLASVCGTTTPLVAYSTTATTQCTSRRFLHQSAHHRRKPTHQIKYIKGVRHVIHNKKVESWTSDRLPRNEVSEMEQRFVVESKNITVGWTGYFVVVQDNTSQSRRALSAAALRDSCTCALCKDASSGQKSFASIEIPPNVQIDKVRSTEAGLAISFRNDIPRFQQKNHEMILPWVNVDIALRRRKTHDSRFPSRAAILRRTGVQYWDSGVLDQHIRKIDYHDFMKGETAFWDVIIDILRLGIVYLKNVPRDESSIVAITTRIANIRETFYGRTFDVRAKPNAENVAYTSGYLGLHQDLCYLEPPPMIQVLHCMDNSCAGGESLFSDGERVGRLLWPYVRDSELMAPLADHLVPYQYDKHGYFYHAKRPVLARDSDGEFAGVFWSPPFQGTYQDPSANLQRWLRGARVFEGLINEKRAVHSYKMEPGECVLFDNLRVMHGRNAFDASAGGSRWLRGAYIAAEDFLSKAAYIPDGQAEAYRGSAPWTPMLAETALRRGPWSAHVQEKVGMVDKRFRTYGQRK